VGDSVESDIICDAERHSSSGTRCVTGCSSSCGGAEYSDPLLHSTTESLRIVGPSANDSLRIVGVFGLSGVVGVTDRFVDDEVGDELSDEVGVDLLRTLVIVGIKCFTNACAKDWQLFRNKLYALTGWMNAWMLS